MPNTPALVGLGASAYVPRSLHTSLWADHDFLPRSSISLRLPSGFAFKLRRYASSRCAWQVLGPGALPTDGAIVEKAPALGLRGAIELGHYQRDFRLYQEEVLSAGLSQNRSTLIGPLKKSPARD